MSPVDPAVRAQVIAEIRDTLRARPVHDLYATARGEQEVDRDDLVEQLLALLEIDPEKLQRELHTDRCSHCSIEYLPSQEVYRSRMRRLYRWAGREVTGELAELAPDVPRPGDTDTVFAAITGEWETWQVVTRRLDPPLMNERYWAAVAELVRQGLVEHRDIAVRRVS